MEQLDLLAWSPPAAAPPFMAVPAAEIAPPAPAPILEADTVPEWVRYRERGREVIPTDPKRFEFRKGDISNAYSGQSLMEQGAVRSPFKFRGCEWVTGGTSYCGDYISSECYRLVPLEAFEGSSAPYSEHPWDRTRGTDLGGYHGMRAKHGGRTVVLQGPPVIFTNAGKRAPEQVTLL